MTNEGYFRFPSIRNDTVVFVCEDDLWSAPAEGGVARRLTVSVAGVSRPALSPDGSQVAFTGKDEAHSEIYCMPAEGGPARRLTYLGANSETRGWTPDGRVVFASDAAQPFFLHFRMHAVPPEGGLPQELPLGWANDVSFGPGGRAVVGRHTLDPATWKRYRGGRAGVLWIDPEGKGRFRRLLDLPGNLGSPMWIGDRIWFVSDHEGTGNIYSCTPGGEDLRRHTDHEGFYARLPATDGRRIVYQCAAELWLLDPGERATRRIDIEPRSPRAQRRRKFVDAQTSLQGYAVHPAGHSVAIEARGRLFAMPLWEEAVRQYGAPDGVRYRLGQWLPDGRTLVAVSDAGGEEGIETFSPESADRARRLDGIDIGRVVEMACSPTRNEVAVANHRDELILVDLDAGTARTVDRSPHHGIGGLAWSPDGAWLAYGLAVTPRTHSIKICDARAGECHLVTRPEFRDFAPSFDPEGRYLYFLSARSFDPVYDALFFDLGFPKAVRPYLITLRSDARSPFQPEPRGLGGDASGKTAAASAEGGDGPSAEQELVRIDLDGIEDRVLAFPVPEGRYLQVRGIKGKVLFATEQVEGSLGRTPFDNDAPPKGTIEAYNLREQKSETLVGEISDFAVSRDGGTLVYRAGKRLRAIKAGEKPDDSAEKETPGRKSGWLDLTRLRVSVDPPEEWRQMYREAWRLQRDNFWTADMSGIDWPAVHDRYLPLVDKVASRLEFSDLIWDMQGELGTSHAYEIGGDHRAPSPYRIGHLGADLAFDEGAGLYRFARVLRGDPWDEPASSPLARAGTQVREGDYRDWVEANRERVHRESDGRLGYLHVPDMGPAGYSEFHRSYFSEAEREGLIVDVRFNRGGHVSQLILEKLARRRVGYDVSRWGTPDPYPADSVLGPVVAITNERAGSDGDIFSHCFKLMGIGPIVGKRTWGGVVGINVRHTLADGGVTTQPEFSFWFRDVGWGVENYGTDPTHEVDIAPQDYAAGRDPQLEVALELALRALKESPPEEPSFDGRPNLAPPPLPPRA
ncbi:MAG: PD40 domain-containing protein [Acidobacteria bacterium]|nr:PD40 domain-containing protein [Acidobacteriota bacterium]